MQPMNQLHSRHRLVSRSMFEEQDVLLLKEILTVGPHRASFGRVTESWDLVARNLNSNYPEQFNNKISGIHSLLHLPVG